MFAVHSHPHLANVDAVLAILVHRYGFAIKVFNIAQRLEVSVAVPTQHKVNAARASYHLLVADTVCYPSQMGNADNKVAFFFLSVSTIFCAVVTGSRYTVRS